MYWFYRFVFVMFLFLGFCVGACDTTETNVGPSIDIGLGQANPAGHQVEIGDIWEQPGSYDGHEVLLEGTYLGWRGQVAHPRITRSDWALQDGTGSIYVSGMSAKGLDPVEDIGRRLEVMGTVMLNDKSVPYILAEEVRVLDEE